MNSELVFDQIEGNFWYAAYGPFRVIMMKDTGYVNATKLCSSGGKKYENWVRLNGSQELIQALEGNMVLENTHCAATSTLQDAKDQIWSLAYPPCIFIKTD